jgi:hypothetical protein
MSEAIRQQIIQHLSDPKAIHTFLFDVRQGLSPCPSDGDILQALEIRSPDAPLDAIRASALGFAHQCLLRRRIVAERQQRWLEQLRIKRESISE